MIVQCPKCSTKFRFDESKLTAKGARMRCTKCRHLFVVQGGGQVVRESNLDQTTRPAFDGELDGVLHKARGGAAPAPPRPRSLNPPPASPQPDIEDVLGKIDIPNPPASPFADPLPDPFQKKKVLNTLEDAIIKPKLPTPVTDLDMPRPSESVQRTINDDTYNRRVKKPLVSSDDDWNRFDTNNHEVNVDNLQQRIDHITNVSKRPQAQKRQPEPQNTVTYRGPEPAGATEWKTSGETARYGTTSTARRGLAGRPQLADAPPSLGGRERSTGRRRNPADPPGAPGLTTGESTTARRRSELLDPIMAPPPSSGNTAMGRRPKRKAGVDVDDLNATPMSGGGSLFGDGQDFDEDYTPVKTMKNNTLQKLLVFIIILVGLLIGMTAVKMGDRFDITRLTPQVVMYEVFGIGSKPRRCAGGSPGAGLSRG